MNNVKKYIWSIYILLWVYFIFFDSSVDQASHIDTYLVLGWIPFVIVHFIWRNKTTLPTVQEVSPSTDDQYKLLWQIHEKEMATSIIQASTDAKIFLKDNQQRLEDFGKRIGRDVKAIDQQNDEYFKLSVEEMKEYEEIKNCIAEFQLVSNFGDEYVSILEETNRKLLEGLSLANAKTLLDAQIQDANAKRTQADVAFITARILGEEIVSVVAAVREKNPNATAKEINQVEGLNKKKIFQKVNEEIERKYGVKAAKKSSHSEK